MPFHALARLVAAALLATVLVACSEGDPDPSTRPVKSVGDFDKYPCGLFTKLEISIAVAEPFRLIAGAGPVLDGSPRKGSDADGAACVYEFKPDAANHLPQVESMTVSLSRSKSGEQQLGTCLQGAAARARGYQGLPIGEKACVSPSADLWMKVGPGHYHVVAVAQPGWTDVVEGYQAIRTVSMSVANAAAERLPRV